LSFNELRTFSGSSAIRRCDVECANHDQLKTNRNQLRQVSLRFVRLIAANRDQTKHSARDRMLTNSHAGRGTRLRSTWKLARPLNTSRLLSGYPNCGVQLGALRALSWERSCSRVPENPRPSRSCAQRAHRLGLSAVSPDQSLTVLCSEEHCSLLVSGVLGQVPVTGLVQAAIWEVSARPGQRVGWRYRRDRARRQTSPRQCAKPCNSVRYARKNLLNFC
jgi:hypothetical protein